MEYFASSGKVGQKICAVSVLDFDSVRSWKILHPVQKSEYFQQTLSTLYPCSGFLADDTLMEYMILSDFQEIHSVFYFLYFKWDGKFTKRNMNSFTVMNSEK
jgi:hypothetical protein